MNLLPAQEGLDGITRLGHLLLGGICLCVNGRRRGPYALGAALRGVGREPGEEALALCGHFECRPVRKLLRRTRLLAVLGLIDELSVEDCRNGVYIREPLTFGSRGLGIPAVSVRGHGSSGSTISCSASAGFSARSSSKVFAMVFPPFRPPDSAG